MMSDTFLQLFLLANVFFMGVLTTIAIRHAYAHFRPHSHDAEKSHHLPAAVKSPLPPEIKEKLLQESQAKFQTALDRSAEELLHDLKATSVEMNKQLEKLGSEVAERETKHYEAILEELRKQTEAALNNTQTEMSGHHEELKTKLSEKVAAEQQRLIQQIDTKLADAVASFLEETLQHNVDLGSQSSYLTAMLEEHKDDFKREVADEAPVAK